MDQSYTKKQIAQARSQLYQSIRSFFNSKEYTETETPILSRHLIPESAIEIFATQLKHPHKEDETLYLTPSPEVYMKALISEGIGDCYQLTKSFRNAESYSSRHLIEFTMLEWYSMQQNYKDNIETTKNLLQSLAPLAHPQSRHLFENFSQVTMQQLFIDYVDIHLEECQDFSQFKAIASQKGFSEYAQKSESWEDLFHFLFVGHIENKLPDNKTIFVVDYPAQIPTTAKRSGDIYERWELYMRGWEMANCYTEETRYSEMQQLFENETVEKNKMMTPHNIDYNYLDIFHHFPQCSGVALGVDRLFAVFMNLESLADVSLFPQE